MTTKKRERLARLVGLQERLKALHETRHAAHLGAAAAAREEAETLARCLEAPDGFAQLFPDLVHARMDRLAAQNRAHRERAHEEAAKAAAASARAEAAARSHRQATRRHEREAEEKAVLEMLENRLSRK